MSEWVKYEAGRAFQLLADAAFAAGFCLLKNERMVFAAFWSVTST